MANQCSSIGIDAEAKLGCQTHRSQQAGGVRLESRLAYCTNCALLNIAIALKRVCQPGKSVTGFFATELDCHGIYGEVAL